MVRLIQPFDNIDDLEIYVINMAKNKDRLDNFIKEFGESDLKDKKINVFPAVVGKELDLLKYITPNAYEKILKSDITKVRQDDAELTRGAVGCYLSHLGIYKEIANSNANYALIFEDDVMINPNTLELAMEGINDVPNDWDMFLLGLVNLDSIQHKNYLDVKKFWLTHAYIIKKEAAIKLLKYLSKKIDVQIDTDMSTLISENKLKVYSRKFNIVVQNNAKFPSEIQIPVSI